MRLIKQFIGAIGGSAVKAFDCDYEGQGFNPLQCILVCYDTVALILGVHDYLHSLSAGNVL